MQNITTQESNSCFKELIMKDVYEIKSGIFITKSGEAIEVKDGYFVAEDPKAEPLNPNVGYGRIGLRHIRRQLKEICEETSQNVESMTKDRQ